MYSVQTQVLSLLARVNVVLSLAAENTRHTAKMICFPSRK
jgi:hypothetical protein